MIETLNVALLEAHASEDVGLISRAYVLAAEKAEAEGDTDRSCFFLTHAWIFALEAGDASAETCHARLAQLGRV